MAAGYNLEMPETKTNKFHAAVVTFISLYGLVSCVSEPITPTQELIPTPEIMLYMTPSPSPVSGTTIPPLLLSTSAPLPTPTPITYKVVKGDTMLGVALKFGISLEELQAANPNVDPRFLSVDTDLIIPVGENIPAIMPTPTPLALQIDQIECFPSADGGRWCTVLVKNTRNRSVENLSAQLSLFSLEGKMITEGIAIAPLNILRKGESIPLSIYFPGPFDQEIIPQASIITSLPVTAEDDRYLNLAVEIEHVDKSPSGWQATISGKLSLGKKSQPANRIWLAVVAYNERGDVVGLRKWEAANNLEPGKSMPFEMTVFSMGPAINRIEVLTEARP